MRCHTNILRQTSAVCQWCGMRKCLEVRQERANLRCDRQSLEAGQRSDRACYNPSRPCRPSSLPCGFGQRQGCSENRCAIEHVWAVAPFFRVCSKGTWRPLRRPPSMLIRRAASTMRQHRRQWWYNATECCLSVRPTFRRSLRLALMLTPWQHLPRFEDSRRTADAR